jgi:general nucleoside transport system permease protein
MKRLRAVLLPPAVAAVISVVVSSIVLVVIGKNPFTAFQAMANYMDSTDSAVVTINRAAPYYVSGLAAAIGFKMGLFNIGVDGQYRLAAILAAAAGAELHLWAPVHVLVIFIIAMLAGGAYAAIPGVLKVKRGVNEVIATILLNYVAIAIVAYLFSRYFRKTEPGDLVPKTKLIPRSGWMPDLNRFFEVFGFHMGADTRLYGYLVVAIIVGVFFYFAVYRSRFGLDLRMTGLNPRAARSSGVNANAMVVRTMVISGVLAGMVGMGPLLSEGHRYGDQFPLTLGFTGIAVALLGRNHPVGVGFGALVWAGLERATQTLPSKGIPQEISKILQGTLLMSAVIAYEVVNRRQLAAATKHAAEATGAAHAQEVNV